MKKSAPKQLFRQNAFYKGRYRYLNQNLMTILSIIPTESRIFVPFKFKLSDKK